MAIRVDRIDNRGEFGSGGPARGIASAETVRKQAAAPNMRANTDGSISFATGKGPGGTEVVNHRFPDPSTPLKRRAADFRELGVGNKIDITG